MVNLLIWMFLLSWSTWRVTALFYGEASFAWLRKLIGITEIDGEILGSDGFLGTIWECFWCLSLVVSIMLSTIVSVVNNISILNWFILFTSSAAGALWIEKRLGISRARL